MHSNLYQRSYFPNLRHSPVASHAVSLKGMVAAAWRKCCNAVWLSFAFLLYALAYAVLSGILIVALATFAGNAELSVGEWWSSLFHTSSSLTDFAAIAISSAQSAPSAALDGVLGDVVLWVLLIGVCVLLCASLPVALVSVLALLSRVAIVVSTSLLVVVLAIAIFALWIAAYVTSGALQLTLHRKFGLLARLEADLRADLRVLVRAENRGTH